MQRRKAKQAASRTSSFRVAGAEPHQSLLSLHTQEEGLGGAHLELGAVGAEGGVALAAGHGRVARVLRDHLLDLAPVRLPGHTRLLQERSAAHSQGLGLD